MELEKASRKDQNSPEVLRLKQEIGEMKIQIEKDRIEKDRLMKEKEALDKARQLEKRLLMTQLEALTQKQTSLVSHIDEEEKEKQIEMDRYNTVKEELERKLKESQLLLDNAKEEDKQRMAQDIEILKKEYETKIELLKKKRKNTTRKRFKNSKRRA